MSPEVISFQSEFPNKTHCLNRWYGLDEFLILSPETTDDAVYFLDSSKLLLSSLACALNQTKCKVPILIQLGSVSKRFFSGIWFNEGIQTNFEMVLLKVPPPQCSSLKEILNFYKKSIPCAVSPFPVTTLSVRYTFCLNNFIGCLCDSHVYHQHDKSEISLPFGTMSDPIQDLLLATTWVGLSELLISDGETGELDPIKAPSWSIRCTYASNPYCSLHSYLDYCVSLLSNEATLINILGTSADDSIEVDVSSAFRNLTKSPPLMNMPSLDISNLPGKLMGKFGSTLDNDQMQSFLNYIFLTPYNVEYDENNASAIKSCPKDSLTYRIVISLCLVVCNSGGVASFAQLWRYVPFIGLKC